MSWSGGRGRAAVEPYTTTDDHRYWGVWMASMGLSDVTDGYIRIVACRGYSRSVPELGRLIFEALCSFRCVACAQQSSVVAVQNDLLTLTPS